VIGAVGDADPNTAIELPGRRQVEVKGGHHRLLSLAQRIETGDRADGAILFEARSQFRGEVNSWL
jgi:hypothetical protein